MVLANPKLVTSAAVMLAISSLPCAAVMANYLYLNDADGFMGAGVDCSTDAGGCHITHYWGGPNQIPELPQPAVPPTWQYVGKQHATTAGRSDAEEKVMVRLREASESIGVSLTTNLSRSRTTTPPPNGTTCEGVFVYVGSVSSTVSSLGYNADDNYLSNRISPRYDFTQETASATTTIGYRSTVAVTSTNGMDTGAASYKGCYRIQWVP